MDEQVLHGRYPVLYGFLIEVDHEIPAGEVWDRLWYWTKRYCDSGSDRSVRFQQLVDEVIEHQSRLDSEQGYPPAYCHKGCANCCYQNVACTGEEALQIYKFCKDGGIPIDFEKLSRQRAHLQFDQNGDFTGITDWDEQPDSDRSCVFLDNEQRICRIWPVRPLVCRLHLAEKTDAYCKTSNGAIDTRAAGIHYPECSYIASAVFTAHHDSIGKTMNALLLARKQDPE